MVPTEVAREVIPFGIAIALFVLPVALIALVAARLTGRRAQRRLAVLVLICVSIGLGYALLVSDQLPWVRAAALCGVVILMAATSLRGRVDVAGVILIAAATPWGLYSTAWLLDGVIAARRIDPGRALPPFVTSVAAIVAGISFVRFHRQYAAKHPQPPPPPEPATRRWNAVSRAIEGPSLIGLTLPTGSASVVLFAGSLISVTAAHGRPILETIAIVVVGTIITGLATTVAWAFARTPRSRRAFEAFAWLGEWELERFGRLTGSAAPGTMTGMKRYVRNTAERADDRWIRTDILVAIGELDAARDMAARIPDDTPYGRVERVAGMSFTDWLSGGPGDTAAVREAAEAIQPVDGDERLRAEVVVAAGEVRDRVAAGNPDPVAPLRTVRDRLGPRADRILLVPARRLARSWILMAGAFVALFTLIDHTTTI